MNIRLKVNPIACTGYGICAELLPELVDLDEWGYPIINPDPIPNSLQALARRAVTGCPALALRLQRDGK
jgi:ferredoxin